MSATHGIAHIAFRHRVGLAAVAAVALSMAVPPPAAQQPPRNPTKEDLAKDNKLFLTLARKTLKWDLPTEPAKIVGPLHYVGTAGLASYLFATKEGHILFNTGLPDSGPMIVESIRKLGFDAKDIKMLINGHGHSDHAGAFAYFKKLTGAQVAIMEPDVAMVETAARAISTTGTTGRSWVSPRSKWIACCATETPFDWVTCCSSPTIRPATRAVRRRGSRRSSTTGGLTRSFRTHHFHEMLRPDIFLGAHAEYFDYERKRDRAKTAGVQAWVNPEEYRQFVAKQKRAFEDEVDLEMGVKK